VVFRKYDGGLHRESGMTLLGEDQHGTWLGASAGTIVHVGGGADSFVTRYACVRLVPGGAWWTALFMAVPDEWDVYCDITTPARWTGAARGRAGRSGP
jgi:hypothetical protein